MDGWFVDCLMERQLRAKIASGGLIERLNKKEMEMVRLMSTVVRCQKRSSWQLMSMEDRQKGRRKEEEEEEYILRMCALRTTFETLPSVFVWSES